MQTVIKRRFKYPPAFREEPEDARHQEQILSGVQQIPHTEADRADVWEGAQDDEETERAPQGQPRQKEMTASFIHIVNIPY